MDLDSLELIIESALAGRHCGGSGFLLSQDGPVVVVTYPTTYWS